jgi:ribosomal protein S18 acetylase RimI-like enzyme
VLSHQARIRLIGVITVRPGRPDDAETVAAVRAASWQAAYQGVIPADILARLTSPGIVTARAAAMRERWPDGVLIAEVGPGCDRQTDAGASAAGGVTAVGFARFGPERGPNGEPHAATASYEPRRAELYAIYVLPGFWSRGTGQALLREALRHVRTAGFATITLWVLEENARARRFYERAGFTLTERTEALDSLGGVTEIRYEMPLA